MHERVASGGVPVLRYAPLWRRAVAAVIDLVVLLLLGWPLAAALGTAEETGYELSGTPALVVIALWLAYYAGSEAAWGASLGKLVTGIRVVAEDGSRLALGAAVVRNVLRLVDGLFLYLVGFLLALASPRRQRLGDRLGSTAVVTARTSAGTRRQEATVA